MSFWKGPGWVKVMVVAALAAGSVARTASAQVLKGRFTLPYEVHWGKAVLSAGTYSITMDSVRGPALVTTIDGRGRCLVRAAVVDSATDGLATGLLITRNEGERTVRSLNWHEGGRKFVYLPIKKAKRELIAEAKDLEAVPISIAKSRPPTEGR
jgi:hypothetical protein